ncbi:MAG UNVERIFIED_CONTAM: hypothetical protein LVR18_14825 [Planctomycetaceae bacterium]
MLPVHDRYDRDGNSVGELPADYRMNNSLFDGRTVRLVAAAGEVVGLQILVRGSGRATASPCDSTSQPSARNSARLNSSNVAIA